jgi:hypothetical protein
MFNVQFHLVELSLGMLLTLKVKKKVLICWVGTWRPVVSIIEQQLILGMNVGVKGI